MNLALPKTTFQPPKKGCLRDMIKGTPNKPCSFWSPAKAKRLIACPRPNIGSTIRHSPSKNAQCMKALALALNLFCLHKRTTNLNQPVNSDFHTGNKDTTSNAPPWVSSFCPKRAPSNLSKSPAAPKKRCETSAPCHRH